MKKKVFGTLLAAALIVTQAISVFAVGSRNGEMALTGGAASSYQLSEVSESNLSDPTVLTKIREVNSGAATLQSIGDLAPALSAQLADKSLLTDIYELTPINGGVQTADGKYQVELSVPSLSSNVTDVALLHYSTGRSTWEIITPSNVDYTNKVVSATFEDLSPVAVIGKVSGTGASVGTSPKTGMTFGWMGLLGAAVVLGATGTVVYKKTRQ